MKFKILFLLIFANISVFAQATKTDLALNNLKGKVKSTFTIGYVAEVKNKKILATEVIRPADNNLIKFNINGYITETYQYSSKNKNELICKITFEFNKKNQIVKKTEASWMGTYVYSYKYGLSDGNLEVILTESNRKLINKYDSKGNRIAEIYYTDNEEVKKSIYKYDAFQNLIEENYPSDNFYDVYKYDSKRNPIEESRYSSKDELYFKNKIVYTKFDKNRNWTEHITYDKYNEPMTVTKRTIVYY